MRIVYLWRKRSASAHLHRLLVFTSVFQTREQSKPTPGPNCAGSIPHSRHARQMAAHCPPRNRGRAYAVLSRLAGRSHGSVASATRGEKRRWTDQRSIRLVVVVVVRSWRGHTVPLLPASGKATEAPYSHLQSPHLLPHHGTGRKKKKKGKKSSTTQYAAKPTLTVTPCDRFFLFDGGHIRFRFVGQQLSLPQI